MTALRPKLHGDIVVRKVLTIAQFLTQLPTLSISDVASIEKALKQTLFSQIFGKRPRIG
jgi:hypothetical protein